MVSDSMMKFKLISYLSYGLLNIFERDFFFNQWYFGTYIIGIYELVSVMYRVEYFFGTCLKSWVQGFVTYMDLFTFSQFICILLYISWCEFGHLFLFATDKIYVTWYRYNFEQYATYIEK